ncbi:CARDB domain-containing protein [Persephonella sp.]
MSRNLFIVTLVFIFLNLPEVMAACTYPSSGNWVIASGEKCNINDVQIFLNGNLTVYGSMTFKNVTLKINATYNGEYGINVANNGILVVTDGSNITSVGSGRYFFYVDDTAAAFNMTDSYLSHVGWAPKSGSLPDGIRFRADNIYFHNNTVYSQIVFERAHNSVISHNTIIIPSSAITGAAALRLEHTDYADVKFNFINTSVFKGYGIMFKYVYYTNFTNNKIYTYGGGTSPGFFGEFSQFNTFRNNSVYSKKFQAYWFRSETKNLDIDTSNLAEGKPIYYYDSLSNIVISNITNAGQIYLNSITNAMLSNITIKNGDNLYIEFSDNITLSNITILNSSSDNLGIKGSTNILITDYLGGNQVSVSTGDRKVNLGIDAYSRDIIVKNCRLISGPGNTLPLRIRASYNVIIDNCDISHGLNNLYPNSVEIKQKGWKSNNITFQNTKIDGKIVMDNNAGWARFVNTTFSILETRKGTYAEVYWYLDTYVRDESNQPVSGVNVTAYDAFGSVAFSELTDASGSIPEQMLISYNQSSSGRVYYYPYIIKAEKPGYNFSDRVINLTGNVLVIFGSDVAPPSFSNLGYTSDIAGELTQLTGEVEDDTGISHWWIEHNNSGVFVNSSPVSVAGAQSYTFSYNLTLNSTVGVEVWWRVWANDSAGNLNVTPWQKLTVANVGEWLLSFVLRDNNVNAGNGYLNVWCGEQKMASYNVNKEPNYGYQEINLTPCNPRGKRITFEYNNEGRGVVYLYNLSVTHKGKMIRFTPWTCTKTRPEMRCQLYSETRFMLGHPSNITGILAGVNVTSSPLIDAPELEIRQSDLKLSKDYGVSQGETIEINATVRNLASRDANNVKVALFINGVNVQNSSAFNLPEGAETTVSFHHAIDYGTKNYIKIEVVAIPENATLEGLEQNNRAVRYLIKSYPYFFFKNFSTTYAAQHLNEEPYASWLNSLQSKARSAYSLDYSDPSLKETDKAINAMAMALYYHITGNESYANKTMEALFNIGNGMYDTNTPWIWANRSDTKGNYGWGNTYKSYTAMTVGIGYAYAYNWVRSYMESYDSTHGTNYSEEAADRLYLLLADLYLHLKEVTAPADGYPSSGRSGVSFGGDDHLRRIRAVGALGTGALTLLDYHGKYADLEGSPEEWVEFARKDLAVESQSGFWQPALDVHLTKDGYYMGGDYLQYFEPAVAYFMKTYYDTFGVNLGDKNPLYDGFAMFLPYTIMPNGIKNSVTAWFGVYQRQILLAETYPDGSLKKNLQYWYLNASRVAYGDKGFLTKDNGIPKYMLIPVYNKSAENVTLPEEASYVSGKPSMAVLRSGFSKDDWYSFFKIINEEYYSSTGQSHADLLTFDIWAKGAYLVPDSGEPRFTNPNSSLRYRAEGNSIGHTTVLVNDSGTLKAVARWAGASAYPQNEFNRAYLRYALTTKNMDALEGYMLVHKVRYPSDYYASLDAPPQKFVWTRGLVLVGNNYMIEYDFFNTSANEYYLVVPLGSTEGTEGSVAYKPRNFTTQLDNRIYGNLSIDSQPVPWFDEASERVVMKEHRFEGVRNVTWETLSESNKIEPTSHEVRLSMYLATSTQVHQNVSVMHYGPYGGKYDYWHPYLKIKVPDNKFFVVYHAYNSTDPAITATTLAPTGGDGNDYALKLNGTGYEDFISISDGENLSYASINTDASFALSRINSEGVGHILLRNFTHYSYGGDELLSSSARVDLYLENGMSSKVLKVLTSRKVNLTIAVTPGYEYNITREGATYSNWSVADAGHLWLTVPAGGGSFEIHSSPPGTLSTGTLRITLLSPLQQNYSTINISIQGYLNYPSMVKYSINGRPNVTLCESCVEFAARTDWARPGNNTITFYAVKGADRATISVNFTVVGMTDFDLLLYIDRWARGEINDTDLLQAVQTWARSFE